MFDDVALVSDQSPDSDNDGIPDALDACPRGSLPASGVLVSDLAASASVSVCNEGPARLTLDLPHVTNACEAGVLSARLSQVNGRALASTPLPIQGGKLVFDAPLGQHELSFDFSDPRVGVLATFKQRLEVKSSSTEACCSSRQSLLRGTGASDVLLSSGVASVCALLGYGRDFLASSGHSDFISGGDDGDYLLAGAGDSVVDSGPGDDFVGGAVHGNLTVYTGAGNDFVDGSAADSLTVYAGAGAVTVVGSAGDDRVFVGPATALVLAGGGDDRVVLYSPCEAHSGLRLVGGAGNDTLLTPLPLDELALRGVVVSGFENVTLDSSQAYLSPCYAAEGP
ncbi:MAG: calcium-binding protein [Polyangiaceae bacterium]